MQIYLNNKYYEVIIERKRIKNTYIKVKDDLKVYVTTNYLTTDRFIENLIKKNNKSINKMINIQEKRNEKKERFLYLGKEYQIIVSNAFKNTTIEDKYIYVKKKSDTEIFLFNQAKLLLPKRVDYIYREINNSLIPYPNVKIRKMVRKWCYCNKKERLITLNRELIKYDIDDIDYVIVHELCHFLHFNHSKEFWKEVKRYKNNYLENKKHLNEE